MATPLASLQARMASLKPEQRERADWLSAHWRNCLISHEHGPVCWAGCWYCWTGSAVGHAVGHALVGGFGGGDRQPAEQQA
ncbi:hypothetical protein KPL84_00660, partial [Bacillus anthracis]|nr:hypothetical protein [Bacillus anthracis]